jgi:hypothetical protein
MANDIEKGTETYAKDGERIKNKMKLGKESRKRVLNERKEKGKVGLKKMNLWP